MVRQGLGLFLIGSPRNAPPSSFSCPLPSAAGAAVTGGPLPLAQPFCNHLAGSAGTGLGGRGVDSEDGQSQGVNEGAWQGRGSQRRRGRQCG